jgi:hypothetical protein
MAILDADRPRVLVAREARSLLKLQKLPVPSEQTTVKLISKIRQEMPEHDELENPWSLAVSEAYGIPPEAYDCLLEIWKWSLIVGRKFTIREAKWVSKLRLIRAIPFHRLLFEAACYALEERISKLLKEDFRNSASLDAQFIFSDSLAGRKVRGDAIDTGILKVVLPLPERQEYEKTLIQAWGHGLLLLLMDKPHSLAVEVDLFGADLSQEADLQGDWGMVYALWLRRLSEGRRWANLSRERKIKYATELRREVGDLSRRAAQIESTGQIEERSSVMDWKPSNFILRGVGIGGTQYGPRKTGGKE